VGCDIENRWLIVQQESGATMTNADETGSRDAALPPEAPPRRAAPVNREQVFAAAWELTREGHRPTIDRIRMRLGGGTPRGSPNTVNAHLNEWWSQLSLRLADRPGAALPALPERIAGALEALWTEALAAARDALREEWTEREKRLRDQAEALEHRGAELAQREHALEARATALEEALALARDQLAAANARAASLEAAEQRRNAEIDALQRRCTAGESENRHLRSQFERDQRELIRRFDAQETRWMREVREARALAKERAKELTRLAAEIRAARRDRDRLRSDLARGRHPHSADTTRPRRGPAGRSRLSPKRAPSK